VIEFRDVSIHFGAQDVLEQVRLRIGEGERVGIVGPNGAGKSTLFSLIVGEQSPYRGEVFVATGRLGYVRQQLPAAADDRSLLDFVCEGVGDVRQTELRIHEIEHELAGSPPEEDRARLLRELGELETRFDHLGGYALRSRSEAALCGLGFQPSRLGEPLAAFSGGWRMRAELARCLVGSPDALLLDEPSNYLDLPAVEWLQRFLKEFPGTLLLISHDRFLLQTLTDVTVEVAGGAVTRYPGGYAYYMRERERRRDSQSAAFRNQERKREHLERFIDRFRAKNTKATQVQSRIKALERMETVDAPVGRVVGAPIRVPPPPHCGHEILRLEDAGLSYDGAVWVLKNVDLRVERGDRTALVGYNGMGKTTLLRVMSGVRPPSAGKRVLGHKVVVGYQSQEFSETIPPERSVLEVVAQAAAGVSNSDIRSILGSFGFRDDAVLKPAGVLSGGEKIRLAFARLFVNPPNFLLLDEPTTHLDMDGREALERALGDYEGTVCFVSHDIAFVRKVATSIIELGAEGVRRFPGGYDYYREKSAGAAAAAPRPSPAALGPARRTTDRAEARRERAQARHELHALTRDLKKTVAEAERRIERLEREKERLLASLNVPGAGTDFEGLSRRLKDTQAAIDAETALWEDAAGQIDALHRTKPDADEG
jgi:ATP-binding cassette subfamily F protein 3